MLRSKKRRNEKNSQNIDHDNDLGWEMLSDFIKTAFEHLPETGNDEEDNNESSNESNEE